MNARTTMKREISEKLVLERTALSAHQVLTLNHKQCVGCGICIKVCPEKAVTELLPVIVRDGRLARKALIDIDANKCVFCGECVVLCPINAIKIEVDGKERIPVVEAEAFSILIKEISVDVNKCDPTCNSACQESCPTDAIEVVVKKMGKPREQKIVEVKIDKQKCIFCKRCELACPQTAIHVTQPMQGSICLNTNLCPKSCRVCVDICPTKAIKLSKNGKPAITEEFCIYCGACQEVCPEKAIAVRRTQVLHSEVKSGAWIKALENLTSYLSLVKELNAKSMAKLREAAEKIG